jgi:multicomponent Na+:H+ antiporter subunit G
VIDLTLDTLAVLLMTLGGLCAFVGGVGILRMPDFYTRMHAAGVTDSAALLLVMLGLAMQAGWSLALAKLAAIVIFLFVTSPTAAYALANAALLSGFEPNGVQRWGDGEEPPP